MDKSKNNTKYQSILKTSKLLLWKHGIKRVTIEEICTEAHVSKMTFYKYFPNKIELAKTILQKVTEESLQKFRSIVNGGLPFTEKVKEMILLKFEASENISTEFINDIYKNHEYGLSQYMEEQAKISLKLFVDFLTDSQNKGLIRKGVKVEFILTYINQAFSMFDNTDLVSKYAQPHDLIMELTNFLFYGLKPNE